MNTGHNSTLKNAGTDKSTSATNSAAPLNTPYADPSTSQSNSNSNQLEDEPHSQTSSDSQTSVDSYITPAQRPNKKQPQKTPFHRTDTYRDVLNGLGWSLTNSSQSDTQPSQSTSPNLEPTNDELQASADVESNAHAQNHQESPQNKGNGICELIGNFLKDAFDKIIKWCKEKIKSLLGEDGLPKMLQSLIATCISSCN